MQAFVKLIIIDKQKPARRFVSAGWLVIVEKYGLLFY